MVSNDLSNMDDFIFVTLRLVWIKVAQSPYKNKFMFEDSDTHHPGLRKVAASSDVDNAKLQKTKSNIVHRIVPIKTKTKGPLVTNIDEKYDVNPGTIKHLRRPR